MNKKQLIYDLLSFYLLIYSFQMFFAYIYWGAEHNLALISAIAILIVILIPIEKLKKLHNFLLVLIINILEVVYMISIIYNKKFNDPVIYGYAIMITVIISYTVIIFKEKNNLSWFLSSSKNKKSN